MAEFIQKEFDKYFLMIFKFRNLYQDLQIIRILWFLIAEEEKKSVTYNESVINHSQSSALWKTMSKINCGFF